MSNNKDHLVGQLTTSLSLSLINILRLLTKTERLCLFTSTKHKDWLAPTKDKKYFVTQKEKHSGDVSGKAEKS